MADRKSAIRRPQCDDEYAGRPPSLVMTVCVSPYAICICMHILKFFRHIKNPTPTVDAMTHSIPIRFETIEP